jgi:hypothetical protein
MHGITDNLEFRVVAAAVAAGSSIDSNSSIIDMADYESVAFITNIADSVATGVATLVIQSSAENSDTAMANITGTAASATCAVNDDLNGTALMAEVRNPSERYVQATRTSATANIAYGEVIAVLKPRRLPAAQGATIADNAYISG